MRSSSTKLVSVTLQVIVLSLADVSNSVVSSNKLPISWIAGKLSGLYL